MEFWSELSKKIASAADYTAKETEKFTSIAKIKYKISGLKSKRDQLYKSIGKMKYAEYCGESTDEISYNEMLEAIKEIQSEIRALEEQIALLKKYRICPTCRTKIDRDMLFCPRCGARVAPDKDEDAENADDADTDEESGAGDQCSTDEQRNTDKQCNTSDTCAEDEHCCSGETESVAKSEIADDTSPACCCESEDNSDDNKEN